MGYGNGNFFRSAGNSYQNGSVQAAAGGISLGDDIPYNRELGLLGMKSLMKPSIRGGGGN